jgi:hypothetical protein
MFSKTEKIIRIIWSDKQNSKEQFYAILDGARDKLIYSSIMNSDSKYLCLYSGELAPDLAEAAPYLVKLEMNDTFTLWLIENGWGKSWGIFFKSDAQFHELRKHFRQFLMVRDDKNNLLYFRYYDPRVLRAYLPTCNEEELMMIYGIVACYYAEGENPNLIDQFYFKHTALDIASRKII